MSDNVAHAISGAVGGMASMAITYPLNTLTMRNQVNRKKTKETLKETLKQIWESQGPAGFYAGLNSALVGIAVTNGVYYYWYELAKALFGPPGAILTTVENMGAGAIAGAATSVFTNPIWVVNTRLTVAQQTASSPSNSSSLKTSIESIIPAAAINTPLRGKAGFLETIFRIYKEEGIAGFFQGVLPALILVSNPIIQYTVFEKLKEHWQKKKPILGPLDFFALGAISKLAATSITYPYIVVKSRMQLKKTEGVEQYNDPIDAIAKIIKGEGIAGLYKGIGSKLLQSMLTSAFLFAFKEELFGVAVQLLVSLGLRVSVPALVSTAATPKQ